MTEERGVLDEKAPASVAGEMQRRAVSGSLWTMLHVAVSVPIAFVANAIVARALGVEDYGHLAFLTLVLALASTVTDLGMNDATLQWGSASEARGDEEVISSLVRRCLGFHLIFQAPVLAVVVLVLGWQDGLFVCAALLLAVLFTALFGTAQVLITLGGQTGAFARLTILTNLIIQVSVSTVAVVTHSASAVWGARTSISQLLMPLSLWILSPSRRRMALSPLVPRNLPAGFWRFGLFSAAGALVGLLVFSRSELLILQGFGAVRAAGLFALAFGLGQQITAPVDALLNPLLPAVAGIVEAHPERVQETLLRATRVSSLLCATITVLALPLLFVLIPVIYGEDFRAAAAVFLVLAITSCLQSAINPLLTFTRARRHAGSLLTINCVALGVDVVVAFATVPAFGLWGAVAANLAGQLTVLVGLVLMECRAWDIPVTDYVRAGAPFLFAASASLLILPLDGAGLAGVVTVPLVVATAALAVMVLTRLTGTRIPLTDLEPALKVLPARLRGLVTLALKTVTV